MGFVTSLEARRSREKENERIYDAIGEFLAAHRLYPAPSNYALAYELVVNEDSPVARAVREAISDGLRLRQSEADRIIAEGDLLRAPPEEDEERAAVFTAARRQIDEFASLVELTRTETESYGNDIAATAAELDGMNEQVPVANLIRITSVMLERTRAAEIQLSAAQTETEALRAQLAEVEQEARSDPLTALPNRRALRDRWKALEQAGATISVAICDIDRFKSINDLHGHEVGDRVLQMVARTLEGHCAPHMVARLGGEEFVVLFDGVDAAAAARLIDEVREDLASRHFRDQGSGNEIGRITFSAGIACGCGCASGDPLLQRADALLYEAKNGGRNRIRFEHGPA